VLDVGHSIAAETEEQASVQFLCDSDNNYEVLSVTCTVGLSMLLDSANSCGA
jgi:hypothetical protein